MIVLKTCAMFALLLPVPIVLLTTTNGDYDSVGLISASFILGSLGLEVIAVATIVSAWRHRNDPRPSWAGRSTTIAAALSTAAPWLTVLIAFKWFDGPSKPWSAMLVFVPVVYLALRLLTARGGDEARVPNAERKPSKITSAADVVGRPALGRGHGLEGGR